MVSYPEPHRDQRTIGSFKRTFNAAVLLLVAGIVNKPRPRRSLGLAAVVAAAAVAGHDLGTLLHALPP